MPLDSQRGVARVVCRDDGPTVDVAAMNGSVEEDLARRDFTIDAMALPIEAADSDEWTHALIDPFGGREDLERGLVRMVNDRVFREDPSRLLRGVRLARSFGFRIHEETAAAIADHAHLIDTIAKERVRDEFLTLLSLDAPQDTLHCLDDLGAVVPHCPGVGARAGGKSAEGALLGRVRAYGPGGGGCPRGDVAGFLPRRLSLRNAVLG